MTNRLFIEIILLPHPFPYPENPPSRAERWGEFLLRLQTDEEVTTLLDAEWNIDNFAEWFAESQVELCRNTEKIAGEALEPGESLAHALERLYSREFPDDAPDEILEEYYHELGEFREPRALHGGFRGLIIPDIVIGCNHGAGEVSLCDEGIEWSYAFEMTDFLQETQAKVRAFLIAWIESTTDILVQRYATGILVQLNADLSECCS